MCGMNKEQQIRFAKDIAQFGFDAAVFELPYDSLDKNIQGMIDEYVQTRSTLLNLITDEAIEALEPLSQL